MPAHRRYRIWIGLALAAGALLRAIYLLQIQDSPFYAHFSGDAAHMDRWAQAIAGGDIAGVGPYYRAPLYPYLLGFLYWLSERDFTFVRIVQHVLGLTGVWATAALTARLWGHRAAIVAAWVAALYPTAIFFEGELLLDSVTWALAAFVLLSFVIAHERGTLWRFLMSGILLGIFAITRPTILITVPVFLIWILSGASGKWGRTVLRATVLLAGIACVVLPVTIRNATVGHDAALISTQGGINFYIGNNPTADGVSAVLPPLGSGWTNADATGIAEQVRGRPLKPSAVSDYWYERGWRWITDSPGRWLVLMGRKLLLFCQGIEFANNLSIDWATARWGRILRFIPLSYGLVIAVGLIGWMVTARRDRHRIFVLIWSLVYAFGVALFFVVARFRLPIVPVWIGAAAAGSVWLWDTVTSRRPQLWAPALAGMIAAATLAHIDWFGLRVSAQSHAFLSYGNTLLRQGDFAGAAAALDSGLTRNPESAALWTSRAAAYYLSGEPDSAVSSYARAARLDSTQAEPWVGMAQHALSGGDTAAASQHLERALALKPYYYDAARLKATVERQQGRPQAALETLQRAGVLRRHATDISPLYGVLLLDLRRLDEAWTILQSALQRQSPSTVAADPDPASLMLGAEESREIARVHYNLGVIAGYRGEWIQATTHLGTAVRMRPEMTEAWSNLGTAYGRRRLIDSALACVDRAVTLEPNNAVFQTNQAFILVLAGDSAAARGAVERALQADSTFAPARDILRYLSQ